MTGKINGKPRLVRCPKCLKVLPEPSDVPVYKCGGCDATLLAKKRNNGRVDTTSRKPDDDSSGKREVDQVFGDQEASSSLNQQKLLNSADESDQNSDDNDLHRWNKDQDAANEAKNGSIDAPSGGIQEYLFGKLKTKQGYDDHEASSSSNQQPLINSTNKHEPHQNIHNDPRSSTELSGHEDPESSPEATDHNRIDQQQLQEQEQHQKQDQDHYQSAGNKQENTTVDAASDDDETSYSLNRQLVVNSVNDRDKKSDHNEPHNSSQKSYHGDPESSPEAIDHNRIDHNHHDDLDQEFLSCRREFEESSSEFEEAVANTRTVRVSDGSSKSSFKSLIAEKLLDTKQKKPMYHDEDDTLLEDEDADLHHRRTNDRMETTRFGGMNYYGSEGSVSSFDGNDNQNPRKHRIGDEHVDSSSGYRFSWRNQHHLNSRFGKDNHRLTDVRSSYGFNKFDLNPKHRSHMISENPKLERIELLKMVRELQNQLERTNISNPHQIPARYSRRMAFSGETTAVNRRLDGGSCHHCRPQDRRFSAQLPRQHVCCNGPHYEPNTFYSPRFSAQLSPIHNHSEAAFSAADDYIHRNNDVSNPLRSPKKKRYIRPIAHGSPWVMCYRCSTLLELPQSFLVFNKKYHSLRCGACMRVLNFTLSNGTHVSRYYPEETITAPPSSEVEDYDELNGSRAGPVSCTDSSFQKNYSTETDRNGSWEFSEGRRKETMSRDPSGSTHPSSSKNSGRPRPNGSPLHQLMGYTSPSKVIRGQGNERNEGKF